MYKYFNLLIAATFSFFLCTSCYYDVEEDLYPQLNRQCDTLNVQFSTEIQPVIINNCYVCHGNGNLQGNIDLTGYENIKIQALNGKLVGAVSHAPGFTPMPQGGNKLTDCQISKIKSWIKQGTQNN